MLEEALAQVAADRFPRRFPSFRAEAFGDEFEVLFQMLFGPRRGDELFKPVGGVILEPRIIGDWNNPIGIRQK